MPVYFGTVALPILQIGEALGWLAEVGMGGRFGRLVGLLGCLRRGRRGCGG